MLATNTSESRPVSPEDLITPPFALSGSTTLMGRHSTRSVDQNPPGNSIWVNTESRLVHGIGAGVSSFTVVHTLWSSSPLGFHLWDSQAHRALCQPLQLLSKGHQEFLLLLLPSGVVHGVFTGGHHHWPPASAALFSFAILSLTSVWYAALQRSFHMVVPWVSLLWATKILAGSQKSWLSRHGSKDFSCDGKRR